MAPKASIPAEQLVSEGRKLARPAIVLLDKGSRYAATWQGTGVLPPPRGKWEHWVSLDLGFLPTNPRGLTGVISVFLCIEDGKRFHKVTVVHEPGAKLPSKSNGKRLFAETIACLPHADALLRYGSEPVQNWLEANEWYGDWGYNDNFPDPAPVEEYQNVFRQEHPFFHAREVFAMVGGWSFPFDSDWARLSAMELIILTIRDSEPWLEVFYTGKKFDAQARTT